MENKALILIDIQGDYFAGGRNPLFKPEQAAERAGNALTLFRNACLPIFHVQHINLKPNAPFFSPDTEGCTIHKTVCPLPTEPIIVKHTPDSFFQTDLHEQLSTLNVKELYICGMMSHMCIDTSVRTAKRLGYTVFLIDDACTTRDLIWDGQAIPAQTVHKAFMASLNGTFAEIIRQRDLFDKQLIKGIK